MVLVLGVWNVNMGIKDYSLYGEERPENWYQLINRLFLCLLTIF